MTGLSPPALSVKGKASLTVKLFDALLTQGKRNSKGRACHYYYHCPVGRAVGAVLPRTASFPGVLFLDHDVFERSPVEFPPAGFDVPPYVATEIGDFAQRRLIASQFFSTIHLWMPIVSKRRFFNDLLNPLTVHRSDIALLCLSMKLVMWSPSPDSPDSHTTTYLAARQFLYSVDISGSLTLPSLQAAILIAIYEIGHAIYPGAHTSVSVCVQYAIAMGLGWKTVRWGENNLSWIETEERTRVWWAIVILERYVLRRSVCRSSTFSFKSLARATSNPTILLVVAGCTLTSL